MAEPCPCSLYKLVYTFNNKTDVAYTLVNGNLNVDNYFSMYKSTESERMKLLFLNIRLFNPYTVVNASEKFIEYAQLFHNIPTQLMYMLQ